MENNLAKTYQPKDFEDRIYKEWEESGSFHPKVDKNKKPFCIVMPPPNITGQLHMGHALDQTLQDALTRWKRMEGYSALWIPGTDHASIATEVKVVEEIFKKEGKTKEEIGREEFLKRAWKWKEVYGRKITVQMRKLGNSCDWQRERFTMDEGCSKAVNQFFVKLYERGYIYRGNRLVNWCPSCGTSISEAEVEHEDKNSNYWYFKYPAADGGEGIVVATSRPETIFADVAIAVNPDDKRYKDMIGKKVLIPILNREIPIISDEYPDPEKGTGAVKITPAHDPNDFEVGERHGLDSPVCMEKTGKMGELSGKYEGMDRFECRKTWVKELEAGGFLVKQEEKSIPIGTCYRCDTIIEPTLSEQWFVKMKELAKPAIAAAKNKDITHIPDRFEKIYLHWLEGIRDWCVSRQLWWGHRIPAYYCEACDETVISAEAPTVCPRCNHGKLKQDEDVLDTWFSSALWPFSTLGWPEKTEELEYFYPTDVLVTAHDIIFFWVVRMAFSGLEMMEEVPFRKVYIHGLVRDEKGIKMSKSLGNGIDPLEVIDKYGADALRFMLMTGNTLGNDMRFQMEKIESSRNFANKLWNASRFVIMNLQDEKGEFHKIADGTKALADLNLRDEDGWIIYKINRAIEEVTHNMNKFELALGAQKIYELIWNEYCDWYIELVKKRINGDHEETKEIARSILLYGLKEMLRLLHPFMPYITEEIWGFLPKLQGESSLIINETWPKVKEEHNFKDAYERIERIKEVIRAIRNVRAEAEAPPSKKLTCTIIGEKESLKDIKNGESHIKNLGNMTDIKYTEDKEKAPEEAAIAVVEGVEIHIPLDDLLDYKAEFERLKKEEKKLDGEVVRIVSKLSNQGFIGKAPEEVIKAEKEKLLNYEDQREKVKYRIALIEKRLGE